MWGSTLGRYRNPAASRVVLRRLQYTTAFRSHHASTSFVSRVAMQQRSSDSGPDVRPLTYSKHVPDALLQRKRVHEMIQRPQRERKQDPAPTRETFRTVPSTECAAERDVHLKSVFALICVGVVLSGFTRHFIAQRAEPGAFLQTVPQQQDEENTKVTVPPPPLIVVDPDPYFDPREKEYQQALQRYEDLLKEATDGSAENEEQNSTGYGWAQTFVNLFAGYDFNEAFEKTARRRLLLRSKPEPPVFRTATPVHIGLRHVPADDKVDRYCLGLLPVHDDKLFIASVISGHGGTAMAEYARKTLHSRLEEAIGASPLYLLLQSIRHAFERLDEELKRYCSAACELHFYEPLNMGLYILTVLIDANTLYVANIGNGKAVISREGKAYLLSSWHGADSNYEQRLLMQTKRREQNTVQCRTKLDVPRKVNGIASVPFWATSTLGFDTVTSNCLIKGLAPVTRGLGHFGLKDPGLGQHLPELRGSSGYPYIYGLPTTAAFPRTKYDEFLILGTGGFWDYVEEAEAVAIVREEIARILERNKDASETICAAEYAQPAADALAGRALENYAAFREQRDLDKRKDITAMVIPLNVESVCGVPQLNTKWRSPDQSTSLFKQLLYWVFSDSDEVIKTADYRTKIRWLHERQGDDRPQGC